jgi:hypothetical protein
VTVVVPEPPEPVPEADAIVTVRVPVELAKFESPEYVAVITCEPEVLEENE